jgi:uncharacterized membrane protein YjjP (DUF1212 family)
LQKQVLKLRTEYAKKTWLLCVCWSLFSGGLALLQFCKPWDKHLEKAEFIAIVATTLVSIIALYLQVGKGIFPRDVSS